MVSNNIGTSVKNMFHPMGVKLDGLTLVPETSIFLILGYQLDDEPIHDY